MRGCRCIYRWISARNTWLHLEFRLSCTNPLICNPRPEWVRLTIWVQWNLMASSRCFPWVESGWGASNSCTQCSCCFVMKVDHFDCIFFVFKVDKQFSSPLLDGKLDVNSVCWVKNLFSHFSFSYKKNLQNWYHVRSHFNVERWIMVFSMYGNCSISTLSWYGLRSVEFSEILNISW